MKETGPRCQWPGIIPGLSFEWSGLEFHPIANTFPLMEGEESRELVREPLLLKRRHHAGLTLHTGCRTEATGGPEETPSLKGPQYIRGFDVLQLPMEGKESNISS
jgi:hypothetical protein